MITERQKQLLKVIISSYLKEAQPVASGFLVKKLKASISSATIRNEMVALEKEGLIEQPYTSAGRVPTEKAYQYYVDELVDFKTSKSILNLGEISSPEMIKNIAKRISEITGDAVIVAFAKNDFYYTGISNLFAKEEFADRKMLISVSQIIDHLDKVVGDLFDDLDEIEIMIGHKNPFGTKCSALVGAFSYQKEKRLIAIVGPLRMDYEKAHALIKEIVQNIK